MLPVLSGRGQMARKRYKEQGTGSFFGEYLYERTVPDSHFLRQLEGLVDWEVFAEKLGKVSVYVSSSTGLLGAIATGFL